MQIEVHTRRRFGAREEDIAGWHVVRVTGEVDANTAGMLPTLVLYAVRRGAEQVCLDLSDLERVDRSGAEALRRCTRAARYAGGRLAMIEPDDPGVAEVLADTGVARDVPVVSQREQLAAAARRGPARRYSAASAVARRLTRQNASTTSGSNCVPAHRRSSSSASPWPSERW
jgi:anti-anti-sigma factor